ncbi:hypothetical protein BGX29_007231 [Mortierella sp. GBA35]|nr:hypothetical protein BGX29_007231 [Mortierella sp. GBA35]
MSFFAPTTSGPTPTFGANLGSFGAKKPSAPTHVFGSTTPLGTGSPFGTFSTNAAAAPVFGAGSAFGATSPYGGPTAFDMTVYGAPKVQELTLSVKSKRTFPEKTLLLSTATQGPRSLDGPSSWNIKVECDEPHGLFSSAKRRLDVEVSWNNGRGVFSEEKTKITSSATDLDIRMYRSMTFIPKRDPSLFVTFPIPEDGLLDVKPAKGSIEQEKVASERHAYEFDIVLSTATTVARTPQAPLAKNHDILPLFLKDPHSVDVCFTFPNDPSAAGVGLWAHRVVLRRTKVFAKMIDDAVQQAVVTASADSAAASAAAVNAAVAAALAASGTRQQQQEATKEKDESKQSSPFSFYEDDTSSITSFTDVESQAGDSSPELSFSEPGTPSLSNLTCERRRPTTAAKKEKQTDATTEEKAAGTETTQQPTQEKTPGTGKGPRTLTFAVEQVNMSNFCAMLQYLYTGEINLTPDARRFTFSHSTDRNNNTKSNSGTTTTTNDTASASQPDRETAQWFPHVLPFRLFSTESYAKHEDLMLAAELYGIDDLMAHCQLKVEQSMSSTNVCHILFDIAPRYPKIKAPALAYMVKNRSYIFTKETDPFAPYRNHPDCYNLMLEVVQLLAASK